jgi:hypothetical protein
MRALRQLLRARRRSLRERISLPEETRQETADMAAARGRPSTRRR